MRGIMQVLPVAVKEIRMTNLEVDVFKHYDSFAVDILVRSGKNL